MLMQEATSGLTIPILHDAFHAVTYDILCQLVNGAHQSKEIEKRNYWLGDEERLNGTR